MVSFRSILVKKVKAAYPSSASSSSCPKKKIRSGFVAIYAGVGKERFMVRTRYLSHPLFKMLLEKAANEFEFEQTTATGGLLIPCTASAFREVVDAVEQGCRHPHRHGGFDITNLHCF